MLHEDVAKDEVALERFKREYEISALLPHDTSFRSSTSNATRYRRPGCWSWSSSTAKSFVIVLKRERVLPPERVVRMLSQVAIGLDQAHARGFIHRDLKPDNLFLCGTREGDMVKLLDFGSVKDKSGTARS